MKSKTPQTILMVAALAFFLSWAVGLYAIWTEKTPLTLVTFTVTFSMAALGSLVQRRLRRESSTVSEEK